MRARPDRDLRALVVVGVACGVLGALGACGAGALPHPRAAAGERDGAADANVDGGSSSDAAAEAPIVDAAALGAELAPGMRLMERTKLDADGGGYQLAPTDADRCYRIALLTAGIVDATLTDDAGHVLATARGTSPTLGAKGPVCLRRGRRATISVGADATAELIVWTAP